VVLLDCAQTMLDVRWDEGELIRRAAKTIQLPLPEDAAARYRALHRVRRSAYVAAHQTADGVGKFWDSLLHDWRSEEGIGEEWHQPLTNACESLIFVADSPFFRRFEDVVPSLARFREIGIRLGVVSNWDSSLERLLQVHGLRDYFEVVAASLVVGVEKPDPRIFEWTLDQLQISRADCLHIGDSEEDDAQGAKNAGIRYRLIDRVNPRPGWISRLEDIAEDFVWTA